MNYQKVLPPQSQYYSHHVFYENPEYIDEAESFIDNVSYSESDGFIGFPMVQSVPSYDLQELYIRNPLATSSQILPVTQRNRRYLNGPRALPPEYVYELKPRPPSDMKVPREANGMQNCSPPLSSLPRRSSTPKTQPRVVIKGNKNQGMSFRSSPTISLVPKGTVPKHSAQEYSTANLSRTTSHPSTPLPAKNMCSSSEPITNYQGRPPYRTHQFPPNYSRSQETKLSKDGHRTDSSKCINHPVIVESEGEVKKMNSEGDATGCPDINELDTIGRIAATLDEDEAEKLSDKQRMEIKEMSKFLIPRVPSSVRSLQDKTRSQQLDAAKEEEFKITFRKSLDSILNQLENCESSLNAVRSKFSTSRSNSKTSEKDMKDEIFNLKEISEKLARVREEENSQPEVDAEVSLEVPNAKSENTIEDRSSGFNSRTGSRGTILDDTSALDLHRSKSYIVSLIDRALSKELGTVSNEGKERFQDLDPIKAVNEIVKNTKIEHRAKAEEKFSDLERKTSSFPKDDEPAYIKQLKELRWGHFKHIQQEVKRLEDLERFLDHCGTSDNGTF